MGLKAQDRPEQHASSQEDAVAYVDQALWLRFAEADTAEEFCHSWLALQCAMIHKAHRGVVVLGDADSGPFSPVAFWPEDQPSSLQLAEIAERALVDRRAVAVNSNPDSDSPLGLVGSADLGVAYPIQIDGRLHGAVAVEIDPRDESALQAVMRQLQWGAGWLEILLRREQAESDASHRERLVTALDLTATLVSESHFQAAATAFATELVTRLECDRVSIGFARKGHVHVAALSHSAQFGKQMNLLSAIGLTMDEAVDQQSTIRYPASEDAPLVTRHHAEFAREHGSRALLSIPFMVDKESVGAVTFERHDERRFDDDTVELCETIIAIAGPIMAEKRQNARPVVSKVAVAANRQVAKLIGPRHPGLKLATALLVALGLFLTFATGDYRVTGEGNLEAAVQRAVVAPFNGYIASSGPRAGDLVQAGDELGALDDKDLRLQAKRWSSQRSQLSGQYREALANHERAQAQMLKARIEQAEAQLALTDEQLRRTKLIAPFDGLIVVGDLSQQLGGSVQRGEVLFEVAPLDEYRIVLQVDERDIGDVIQGQRGNLVLSSLPDARLDFTISKVTPVSTASEGRNYFRVEARLDGPTDRLRPGMEGIGKINVEPRRLIWIWSHELVDWLRLWFWSWRP